MEVKWKSLYRAYKNSKDRGTGTSASKFLYLSKMEELFQSDPAISSPHLISVGVETCPTPAPMVEQNLCSPDKTSPVIIESPNSSDAPPETSDTPAKKRKRKNDCSVENLEIFRIFTKLKIKKYCLICMKAVFLMSH